MADFVAVLRKTIEGLKDNSPEMREKVYDKARATIEAKLAALNPQPPAAVADRQRAALEDAIDVVRDQYDEPPHDEAEDDFADLFAPDDSFAEADDDIDDAGVYAPAPVTPAAPATGAPATNAWDDPVEGYADERDQRSGDASPLEHDDGPYSEPDYREEDDEAGADPYAEPDPSLARRPSRRRRRGVPTGAIAALLVLLVIAGAAYGIWLNRSDFAGLFGAGGDAVVTTQPLVEDEAETSAQPAEDGEDIAAVAPDDEAPAETSPQKFTQRLLADGTEVDEGTAEEEPSIGEGTSVAASTPAAEATGQVGEDAASDQPQLAVGQRAIFYEERTSTAEGSAETGTILWSLVQESPGADLPPEAAIRAEVTIPGRDLQLRMTIRRNGDQSLPASHIIEMIFLTPDNFAGGTIDNVLRVTMKDSEQSTGSPLIGIPAKIADGFFLVALSDSSAEIQANMALMRQQNWIDVPIVYGSGQRALMTMEKGVPGERVFQEAVRAWTADPLADDTGTDAEPTPAPAGQN